MAELERLVAGDLTHPALVAPLAAGISGVSAYLVQDYVAADSLDLAVREYGPAPVANALRVAAQLAGALDFAAAVQTNHGALHPRDVLLSSDETRLTGIGLTRALYRIGAVAPVRRPYTAPERVAGGEWDRRADVFSLAALMHELIWGKRVSGLGARAAQSLTEIDGTDLRQLREVFARALAERPGDRYETALAFAEALKNACPEVEVAPEPPPTRKRRTTGDDARRLPLDAAQEEEGTVAETVVGARSALEPNASTAPGSMPGSGVAEIDIPLSPAEPDIVYQPVVEARQPPPLADTAMSNSAALASAHGPEPFSALERTRSAVWPLVLALLVGIAIGFAGGFFAGSREQPTAPSVAATVPPAPAGQQPPVTALASVPGNAHDVEGGTAAAPQSNPKSNPPSKPQSSARTNLQSSPQSAARNPQPEADGRLLVRSRPAGARVSVDGKDQGATPAIVRGLARGAHRVRIAHEGYATNERRFVVTSSRPSQSMTVELEPVRAAAAARPQTPVATQGRFVGALAIDSRPTGAKVFMDGALVGTTPMALPSVAAGSHAIRLEHDGYRRWSSSVRVVASEQNRVTASLER